MHPLLFIVVICLVCAAVKRSNRPTVRDIQVQEDKEFFERYDKIFPPDCR